MMNLYGPANCEMVSYELSVAVLRRLIYALQITFYELQF